MKRIVWVAMAIFLSMICVAGNEYPTIVALEEDLFWFDEMEMSNITVHYTLYEGQADLTYGCSEMIDGRIIRNDGNIIHHTSGEFEIPLGATFELQHGIVE